MMEELEGRVAAFLQSGSREQQAWLETWTRSPAVWARLPGLLAAGPSPSARPFLAAAAAASCAAPSAGPAWRSALARALLPLSPADAVRCDPGAVFEAAVAARSLALLAACWRRPAGLQPGLRAATDGLLDERAAGEERQPEGARREWAALCLAAGGPRSPAQWSRCLRARLRECLMEAAGAADPAWLASVLPRDPPLLLPVVALAGRSSPALLAAAAAAAAARDEWEREGTAALAHLLALPEPPSPSPPPPLLPLLAPLVARLAERGPALCGLEEEEEDDEEGVTPPPPRGPYEAALERLTAVPRAARTAWDCRSERLAAACSLAALRDPPLRAWLRARLLALAAPPASASALLQAALLLRLAASTLADEDAHDALASRAAALQAHWLAGPRGDPALARAIVQLYALATALLEQWEESPALPPAALALVERAARAPHPCPASAAAAAAFAASALLRLRHLLPPLEAAPPPTAPPRLVAGWLALALAHHRRPLAPLALSWSYAAVAADALGPDLPELLPLLRLEPDGSLDAVLVLRVCGVRVPFDAWSMPPANEAAAARLVEVTGQFEPALARFPDSTLVLGAILSSVQPVPIQLLAQAVCCNDLTVQAAAVAMMLKRCPVPRGLGGPVTAALVRQVSTPHATQAIKLLHKISVDTNWAFLASMAPHGLVMSPDLAQFDASIRQLAL